MLRKTQPPAIQPLLDLPPMLRNFVPWIAAALAASVSIDAAAEDAKQCLLVGPAVEHMFSRKLYRIENFDQLRGLTKIRIIEQVNAGWAKSNGIARVTEQNLSDLLERAKPLPPDDDTVDKWHYAPYYSATFECGNRKWSVGLFLGGLGFLRDEEGRSGAFMYENPRRDVSQKP
jgi:hypothetical protein